jgi:hypothetical protein
MLLRIPHAARAGRCISTSTSPLVSKIPALPTRSPALLHNQVRPFSLSWKTDLRMASEDPEKVKEVRKYLQQSHDRIFDNNKKWAAKMKEENPGFFSDLSAGQSPEYLWIGEFIATISGPPRDRPSPFHTTPAQTIHSIDAMLMVVSQAAQTPASPPKPSQVSKPVRCSSTVTSPTSSTTSTSTSCPSSTTPSATSK